ncbi:hypothetical protein AVEN_146706-1 [Araneus ventricosus]|uniref:Uncharacterized protein n=1 Tax=Araneus ventricosus TaxID=182803 RepID=A0A4Y2VYN7_ARAVE|nr:hypothetical protein AVEN_146706-1 [Araneus ventricosus]
MPRFNIQTDDMGLFLELFERQAKFAQIPNGRWVSYLIGILPTEINNLIAREPEDKARDYAHIKSLLLQRFKLTAEKFRQLMVKSQKSPDSTWHDFYHEIKTYFEGWLSGLKVETFDQLKYLMIVDQIKKRTPGDFKEHFLDEWASIISPTELVGKMEEFEDAKKTIMGKPKLDPKAKTTGNSIRTFNIPINKYKGNKIPQNSNFKKESESRGFSKKFETNADRRKKLQCFECGSYEHLRPQ